MNCKTDLSGIQKKNGFIFHWMKKKVLFDFFSSIFQVFFMLFFSDFSSK